MSTKPGRFCPLHYRYLPDDLARLEPKKTDTLYVIGGLYGNRPALQSVLTLAAAESVQPTICFNGDFNWFNIDDDSYNAINETVLEHTALRGNVETELTGDADGVGCGCAYPDWVDGDTVERSNAIMARLQRVAARHPDLSTRLTALPMYAVFIVGGKRVTVVHGDPESLAGWGFAQETIDRPDQRVRIRQWFEAAQTDIFACSHTCLPVMRRFEDERVVFNNGAAGMPNFTGTSYGVVTRIGTTAAPCETLYGHNCGGVYVDAVAVHYPQHQWLDQFLSNWPRDSDAHRSYFCRLTNGPDYSLEQASTGSPTPGTEAKSK